MEPKDWFRSKTLWLNVLALVAVAAGFVADNTGALSLPPQTAVWATLVLALANAGLRLYTNTPIAGSPADKT